MSDDTIRELQKDVAILKETCAKTADVGLLREICAKNRDLESLRATITVLQDTRAEKTELNVLRETKAAQIELDRVKSNAKWFTVIAGTITALVLAGLSVTSVYELVWRLPKLVEAEVNDKAHLTEKVKQQIAADQEAVHKAQTSAEADARSLKQVLNTWERGAIHVGMAVPFFGDGEIPDGFVEIRSGGQWPDAKFMPERLRGREMKLGNDGWLLGCANNPTEIGQLYKEGKVTVNGSAFKIAETESVRDTTPPPGWNAIFGVHEGDFDKKLINPFQQGGEPIKAGQHFGWLPPHKYSDKSASGTAGGKCTVDLNKRECLPLHLMCRWILRVK
jgi:hypothetical protein